ncbi:hypothetical protein C7459_103273 [Tumebacillus permanentifrigoris]|uniref:Uncharacterized protein n=1 Tax=Tumebacillus permanentifrigoris TaxID=378543 RepID=A0A316DBZ6_9BACL|nr:hypothetical protein C7459_103273 [Tumebacillus permanentifrigoris]
MEYEKVFSALQKYQYESPTIGEVYECKVSRTPDHNFNLYIEIQRAYNHKVLLKRSYKPREFQHATILLDLRGQSLCYIYKQYVD